MTQPLGTAYGSIVINTSPALLALARLRAANAATVGTLQSVGRQAQVSGAAIAGIGAAIAYGLYRAIKVAAEFEFSMSYLQATMVATDKEMEDLRETAIKFGTTSGYGPREVAEAFVELGKAGVNAQEIIEGVGRAVVTLGQSADIPLANAASIIVSTQATFGLVAEQAQRTADIIQGAANASLIDVADFGVSMKYVGNVASASGIGVEDLSTAIALVGNEGIRGSTAGTALRRMLLQLTPRTDKAKAAMEELGIITADGTNKFYDQEGSAKSLRDVFQILQDSTEGLTDAKKKDTLATIFGDRAIAAVLATTAAGAAGYDKFNEQLNESTAAEIAAKRFDNLEGSVRKFKGAFEAAFISTGTAAQQPLKEFVDELTGLLTVFTQLAPETQANIAQFALLTAGTMLVVGALSILVGTALRVKAAIMTLRTAMLVLTAAMGVTGFAAAALQTVLTGGLLLALGSVAAIFTGIARGSAQAAAKLGEVSEVMDKTDTESVRAARDELQKFVDEEYRGITAGNRFQTGLRFFTGEFHRANKAIQGVAPELNRLNAAVAKSDENVALLAKTVGMSEQEIRDLARAAGVDLSGDFVKSGAAVMEYYEATVKGKTSTKNLDGAMQLLEDGATDAAGEVATLASNLNEIASINLDVEGAKVSFEQAVNDAKSALLTTNDEGVEIKIPIIFTAEGENTQNANTDEALQAKQSLLGVAEAGLGVYQAQVKQGASNEELTTTMNNTRAEFVEAARAMGMSELAAQNYASEIGLIAPVAPTVAEMDTAAAEVQLTDWTTQLAAVPGVITTKVVLTKVPDGPGYEQTTETYVGGVRVPKPADPGFIGPVYDPDARVNPPRQRPAPTLVPGRIPPGQNVFEPPPTNLSGRPVSRDQNRPRYADDRRTPIAPRPIAPAALPSTRPLAAAAPVITNNDNTNKSTNTTNNTTNYNLSGPVVASDPAELARSIDARTRLQRLKGI